MINYVELQEKIKKLEGPVFVFGASGFIGTNIVKDILSVRDDCFALTHDARSAWRLKLLDIPNKNILHCDITSPISVKTVFENHLPKTVFNLAAYGAYSKQFDVGLTYETNVNGTVNILENCVGVKAYIHAGSSSEYGTNSASPKENDALEPNSHYAVSKASAAYIIKYYARFKNVPALNLRLYSVYGAWEEPDRLIPLVIEKARADSYPDLVDKEISRDFVYISDAVEAFVVAALNVNPSITGNSYNICTGKKTTLEELIETARREFGISALPVWGKMDNRKWDLKNWYGNPENTSRQLGWAAKTSLIEGLRETYKWHQEIDYSNQILPAFQNKTLNAKITAIIACYKDEQAIPIMYERLVKMFNDIKVRYEIIFVNDCSPDNSEEVIAGIAAKDINVIGITHSRNFSSQSAFLSGMEIASGDALVLMDGDLQDPPEIIPLFYQKWIQGFDVVYGNRVKREMSPFMNLIYKGFYRIFSKLSYIKIPVDAGDFSMIDRKVYTELVNLPETEVFLRGLRAWVGFRQTGVDYVRPERMFGKSTNNWRKNIAWAKKAIFSFSFVPLEVLSYFGFILTVISFLAIIAQVIGRLLYPDIPHGITTIIVLILFFGGVQLLAISVLGEYLGKIFEETKRRPKFIKKSVIYRSKLIEDVVEIENLKNTLRKMKMESFKPVAHTPPTSFEGKLKFYGRMILDLQILTIYRDIKKTIPNFKGNVLDVGCGQSPYKFLLDDAQACYSGVDILDADKFDYNNPDITHFNGEDIPFPDGNFDGVICTEFSRHVQNYQKLIDEMHRVLKPGGKGIITIPWSARYHYIPYDFFRYTPSSLRTMFSQFSEVKIQNRGTDIANIANKVIVLWFRNLLPGKSWKWIFVPVWIVFSPLLLMVVLAAHLSLWFNWGSDEDPLGYTVLVEK